MNIFSIVPHGVYLITFCVLQVVNFPGTANKLICKGAQTHAHMKIKNESFGGYK